MHFALSRRRKIDENFGKPWGVIGGRKMTLKMTLKMTSKLREKFSWKFLEKNIPENLFRFGKKLPLQKPPITYTVVASRSHLSPEINHRIKELKHLFGQIDIISVGSSIKQCWVAEGRAHEYPRFGTTMEWDTAAGQCILEQAGAILVDYQTSLPLKYNKETGYHAQ